jgi:rhodanese-related sulfurtransferase
VILVYCRSGNRSKQAAQMLAAMGYATSRNSAGSSTGQAGRVGGSGGQPVIAGPKPVSQEDS